MDDSDTDAQLDDLLAPANSKDLSCSIQILGVTNVPPFSHDKPLYLELSGTLLRLFGDATDAAAANGSSITGCCGPNDCVLSDVVESLGEASFKFGGKNTLNRGLSRRNEQALLDRLAGSVEPLRVSLRNEDFVIGTTSAFKLDGFLQCDASNDTTGDRELLLTQELRWTPEFIKYLCSLSSEDAFLAHLDTGANVDGTGSGQVNKDGGNLSEAEKRNSVNSAVAPRLSGNVNKLLSRQRSSQIGQKFAYRADEPPASGSVTLRIKLVGSGGVFSRSCPIVPWEDLEDWARCSVEVEGVYGLPLRLLGSECNGEYQPPVEEENSADGGTEEQSLQAQLQVKQPPKGPQGRWMEEHQLDYCLSVLGCRFAGGKIWKPTATVSSSESSTAGGAAAAPDSAEAQTEDTSEEAVAAKKKQQAAQELTNAELPDPYNDVEVTRAELAEALSRLLSMTNTNKSNSKSLFPTGPGEQSEVINYLLHARLGPAYKESVDRANILANAAAAREKALADAEANGESPEAAAEKADKAAALAVALTPTSRNPNPGTPKNRAQTPDNNRPGTSTSGRSLSGQGSRSKSGRRNKGSSGKNVIPKLPTIKLEDFQALDCSSGSGSEVFPITYPATSNEVIEFRKYLREKFASSSSGGNTEENQDASDGGGGNNMNNQNTINPLETAFTELASSDLVGLISENEFCTKLAEWEYPNPTNGGSDESIVAQNLTVAKKLFAYLRESGPNATKSGAQSNDNVGKASSNVSAGSGAQLVNAQGQFIAPGLIGGVAGGGSDTVTGTNVPGSHSSTRGGQRPGEVNPCLNGRGKPLLISAAATGPGSSSNAGASSTTSFVTRASFLAMDIIYAINLLQSKLLPVYTWMKTSKKLLSFTDLLDLDACGKKSQTSLTEEEFTSKLALAGYDISTSTETSSATSAEQLSPLAFTKKFLTMGSVLGSTSSSNSNNATALAKTSGKNKISKKAILRAMKNNDKPRITRKALEHFERLEWDLQFLLAKIEGFAKAGSESFGGCTDCLENMFVSEGGTDSAVGYKKFIKIVDGLKNVAAGGSGSGSEITGSSSVIDSKLLFALISLMDGTGGVAFCPPPAPSTDSDETAAESKPASSPPLTITPSTLQPLFHLNFSSARGSLYRFKECLTTIFGSCETAFKTMFSPTLAGNDALFREYEEKAPRIVFAKSPNGNFPACKTVSTYKGREFFRKLHNLLEASSGDSGARPTAPGLNCMKPPVENGGGEEESGSSGTGGGGGSMNSNTNAAAADNIANIRKSTISNSKASSILSGSNRPGSAVSAKSTKSNKSNSGTGSGSSGSNSIDLSDPLISGVGIGAPPQYNNKIYSSPDLQVFPGVQAYFFPKPVKDPLPLPESFDKSVDSNLAKVARWHHASAFVDLTRFAVERDMISNGTSGGNSNTTVSGINTGPSHHGHMNSDGDTVTAVSGATSINPGGCQIGPNNGGYPMLQLMNYQSGSSPNSDPNDPNNSNINQNECCLTGRFFLSRIQDDVPQDCASANAYTANDSAIDTADIDESTESEEIKEKRRKYRINEKKKKDTESMLQYTAPYESRYTYIKLKIRFSRCGGAPGSLNQGHGPSGLSLAYNAAGPNVAPDSILPLCPRKDFPTRVGLQSLLDAAVFKKSSYISSGGVMSKSLSTSSALAIASSGGGGGGGSGGGQQSATIKSPEENFQEAVTLALAVFGREYSEMAFEKTQQVKQIAAESSSSSDQSCLLSTLGWKDVLTRVIQAEMPMNDGGESPSGNNMMDSNQQMVNPKWTRLVDLLKPSIQKLIRSRVVAYGRDCIPCSGLYGDERDQRYSDLSNELCSLIFLTINQELKKYRAKRDAKLFVPKQLGIGDIDLSPEQEGITGDVDKLIVTKDTRLRRLAFEAETFSDPLRAERCYEERLKLPPNKNNTEIWLDYARFLMRQAGSIPSKQITAEKALQVALSLPTVDENEKNFKNCDADTLLFLGCIYLNKIAPANLGVPGLGVGLTENSAMAGGNLNSRRFDAAYLVFSEILRRSEKNDSKTGNLLMFILYALEYQFSRKDKDLGLAMKFLALSRSSYQSFHGKLDPNEDLIDYLALVRREKKSRGETSSTDGSLSVEENYLDTEIITSIGGGLRFGGGASVIQSVNDAYNAEIESQKQAVADGSQDGPNPDSTDACEKSVNDIVNSLMSPLKLDRVKSERHPRSAAFFPESGAGENGDGANEDGTNGSEDADEITTLAKTYKAFPTFDEIHDLSDQCDDSTLAVLDKLLQLGFGYFSKFLLGDCGPGTKGSGSSSGGLGNSGGGGLIRTFLTQKTHNSERAKLILIKSHMLLSQWKEARAECGKLLQKSKSDRLLEGHVLLGECEFRLAGVTRNDLRYDSSLRAFQTAYSFMTETLGGPSSTTNSAAPGGPGPSGGSATGGKSSSKGSGNSRASSTNVSNPNVLLDAPTPSSGSTSFKESAVPSYTLSLQSNDPSKDPVSFLRMGSIYAKKKQYDIGFNYLMKSIQVCPTAEAWRCAGVMLYYQAKESVSSNGNNGSTSNTSQQIKYNDDLLNKSLNCLAEANALDPTRPKIWAWLAIVSAELGLINKTRQSVNFAAGEDRLASSEIDMKSDITIVQGLGSGPGSSGAVGSGGGGSGSAVQPQISGYVDHSSSSQGNTNMVQASSTNNNSSTSSNSSSLNSDFLDYETSVLLLERLLHFSDATQNLDIVLSKQINSVQSPAFDGRCKAGLYCDCVVHICRKMLQRADNAASLISQQQQQLAAHNHQNSKVAGNNLNPSALGLVDLDHNDGIDSDVVHNNNLMGFNFNNVNNENLNFNDYNINDHHTHGGYGPGSSMGIGAMRSDGAGGDPKSALVGNANGPGGGGGLTNLSLLNSGSSAAPLTTLQEGHLHFLLGRAYELSEDYKSAFFQYRICIAYFYNSEAHLSKLEKLTTLCAEKVKDQHKIKQVVVQDLEVAREKQKMEEIEEALCYG